jgi:predicted GH43/DUF377 family glycosyl hydrolase
MSTIHILSRINILLEKFRPVLSVDPSGKHVFLKSIDQASVVFAPSVPTENYGTEDPRVARAPWVRL